MIFLPSRSWRDRLSSYNRSQSHYDQHIVRRCCYKRQRWAFVLPFTLSARDATARAGHCFAMPQRQLLLLLLQQELLNCSFVFFYAASMPCCHMKLSAMATPCQLPCCCHAGCQPCQRCWATKCFHETQLQHAIWESICETVLRGALLSMNESWAWTWVAELYIQNIYMLCYVGGQEERWSGEYIYVMKLHIIYKNIRESKNIYLLSFLSSSHATQKCPFFSWRSERSLREKIERALCFDET